MIWYIHIHSISTQSSLLQPLGLALLSPRPPPPRRSSSPLYSPPSSSSSSLSLSSWVTTMRRILIWAGVLENWLFNRCDLILFHSFISSFIRYTIRERWVVGCWLLAYAYNKRKVGCWLLACVGRLHKRL